MLSHIQPVPTPALQSIVSGEGKTEHRLLDETSDKKTSEPRRSLLGIRESLMHVSELSTGSRAGSSRPPVSSKPESQSSRLGISSYRTGMICPTRGDGNTGHPIKRKRSTSKVLENEEVDVKPTPGASRA